VRDNPGYVDQVPRLEKFRADHPDIEIASPLETNSPFWRAYRDGKQIALQNGLRWLLDKLESLDGQADSAQDR
jgi:hypothetical protein